MTEEDARKAVDEFVESGDHLIDAATICERLDVSRSTFDRWVKDGKFPQPFLNLGMLKPSYRWRFSDFVKTLESWVPKPAM